VTIKTARRVDHNCLFKLHPGDDYAWLTLWKWTARYRLRAEKQFLKKDFRSGPGSGDDRLLEVSCCRGNVNRLMCVPSERSLLRL
jgi:hypothetical protein